MNEESQQLIEKRLRSELTPEEENVFQNRMDSEAGFKELYQFEKKLIENLDDDDWSLAENLNHKEVQDYATIFRSKKTKDLKATLEKVKVDYRNRDDANIKRIGWVWYASAAAIIILFVSVFSLMNSSQTPNELYLSYFDKKEVPSLIHRGNDVDDQIENAQQQFENGTYKGAIAIFDDLLKSQKANRATIYIYKGISEMELNQFADAERTFDTLISSDLMDASKGYWFKSLLYLKMNEKEKAIATLKKIKSESLYNFENADKILESLD